MRLVLAFTILVGLLYFLNSVGVGAIYPEQEKDYDQFLKAYDLRRKIYETMFCLLFFIGMKLDKGLVGAFFAFLFVVCAASCFDKIVLNISHYLLTDYLVVAVGVGAGYYRYKRQRNVRQDR